VPRVQGGHGHGDPDRRLMSGLVVRGCWLGLAGCCARLASSLYRLACCLVSSAGSSAVTSQRIVTQPSSGASPQHEAAGTTRASENSHCVHARSCLLQPPLAVLASDERQRTTGDSAGDVHTVCNIPQPDHMLIHNAQLNAGLVPTCTRTLLDEHT
jgi:hypothetical protein